MTKLLVIDCVIGDVEIRARMGGRAEKAFRLQSLRGRVGFVFVIAAMSMSWRSRRELVAKA
jgi:hypothetical protein